MDDGRSSDQDVIGNLACVNRHELHNRRRGEEVGSGLGNMLYRNRVGFEAAL